MSTCKGVIKRTESVTQVQQQRPESPTVTLLRGLEDVPLVEFIYLVWALLCFRSVRYHHAEVLPHLRVISTDSVPSLSPASSRVSQKFNVTPGLQFTASSVTYNDYRVL